MFGLAQKERRLIKSKYVAAALAPVSPKKNIKKMVKKCIPTYSFVLKWVMQTDESQFKEKFISHYCKTPEVSLKKEIVKKKQCS